MTCYSKTCYAIRYYYYYYYFLLWKFYRCKMVMRYTNFRSWNQFCEEIKSLSKMSWWEEKETAQITENAPCKFPSTYTFKVSQLLCQNSLLLLAAILHSLVHPTYCSCEKIQSSRNINCDKKFQRRKKIKNFLFNLLWTSYQTNQALKC